MRRFKVWLVAALAALGLVFAGLIVAPVGAQTTILCQGVTTAEVKACDSGYAAVMAKMHWRMYAGHNCTNYLAYQLSANGIAEPPILMGNARDWAANAQKLGYKVNSTPAVGSAGVWPGRNHIVYVAEVGVGYLVTREDNYPGYYPKGMYQTLKVTPGSSSYPAQFIHFEAGMKPPAPSGLAVKSVTADAVALDWDPAPGAAAYRVQISSRSDMSEANSLKVTSSNATVTGLAPGVTHYFRVAVVDATNTRTLTPYTHAPYPSALTPYAVPAGLHVTSATDDSLQFGWNAVSGAPKYRIQLSTSSSMSASTSRYLAFEGTSGTVSGLSANTNYYARVWVVNDAVTVRLSGISTVVRGTTSAVPPVQAPAPETSFPIPANLHASAADGDSLTLTWSAVSGAPKYRIQRSASPDMAASTYYAFDSTTATFTGLDAATDYYFRVWVVDTAVKTRLSAISAVASGTTTLVGIDNPAPTGLRVGSGTADSMSVTWDPVKGAPKYRVQVSTSEQMSAATYYAFTGTSATIGGLLPATTYYFRIWAVDEAVKTRLSEISAPVVVVTRTADGRFVVPDNLRATTRAATSLTMAWEPVTDAPKYRVQVSTGAAMAASTSLYYAFTGTSGTIPGLTPGRTYYLRTWVVDGAVKVRLSDISSVVAVTTASADMPYAVPAGLHASSVSATALTMAWEPVTDAPKYRVQVSTGAAMAASTSLYYAFTGTSGTIPGLTPGRAYYLRTWVVDGAVKVRLSDISSVVAVTTAK